MTKATNHADLLQKLRQETTAGAFGKAFANGYLATAFGSLPKSELDLLVFDCLVAAKLVDPDGPVYDTARVLKVTPAKARSLIFQHQLRHANDSELDEKVLKTLAEARFSIDDKRLSFGVESPLVRSVIEARLKQKRIFTDVSLSGEILRVPVNQLGDFVTAFLGDAKSEAKAAALRKKLGKAAKDKDFVDLLNGFGAAVSTELVKEGAKEGVKAAADAAVPQMMHWLSSGGPGEIADAALQFFAQG